MTIIQNAINTLFTNDVAAISIQALKEIRNHVESLPSFSLTTGTWYLACESNKVKSLFWSTDLMGLIATCSDTASIYTCEGEALDVQDMIINTVIPTKNTLITKKQLLLPEVIKHLKTAAS